MLEAVVARLTWSWLCPRSPLAEVDQIVAQPAGRAYPAFRLVEGAQVVEMTIDGGRFLARVGEDGNVEIQLGVWLTGQQEQAGALDSRTEVEDMMLFHALCRVVTHNSQRIDVQTEARR